MVSKNDVESDERAPESMEVTSSEAVEKKTKPKRRISKRKRNLIIVVVIVVAALIIGLWGLAPSNYLTVSDVVNHPETYQDKTIEVKGTVENWNSNSNMFNLSDGTATITVVYTTLPEGFNNGKDVVVKGVLENSSSLVIVSQDVQVGCPSKY